MRRLFTTALIACLGSMAAFVAACGSGDDPAGPGGDATPTPTPTTQPVQTPTHTPSPEPSPTATPDRDTEIVRAPIDIVEVITDQSDDGAVYRVRIVSGLPDSCHTYHDTEIDYAGEEIDIQVMNTVVTGPDVACLEVYETHEQVIDLTGLEKGATYTINVNDSVTRELTTESQASAGAEVIPAPVEEVDVIKDRSGQGTSYRLRIVSGLPNACHSHRDTEVSYEGNTVVVRVTNTVQQGVDCAQVYNTHEQTIDLSGLDPDTEYTIRVNEEAEQTLRTRADDGSEEPDAVYKPAPIEDLSLEVMESFPLQYALVAVTGQENSCVAQGKTDVMRADDLSEDNHITVEITNAHPAAPDIVCAQVYTTSEVRVDLGGGFMPDETYRLTVNGEHYQFTGGSDELRPAE